MAVSPHFSLRAAVGAVGAVLAIVAQVCITYPDRLRKWVPAGSRSGVSTALSWLSPIDAAIGAAALLLLLGTILIAFALRPFWTTQPTVVATGQTQKPLPPLDLGFWCVVAVLTTALLAFLLLSALRPAAIWFWIIAMVWPAANLLRRDFQNGLALSTSLLSRGEWVFIGLVVAAVFVFVGHDLTDLRWAGSGDEARFFATAKEINLGQFTRDPFSEDGLWGYHPMLSHYWQSTFTRVFGPTQFAWRLSSLVAFVLALPSFYVFVREWWNPRVASIALVWFASAPAAITFAHLGYTNIQSLTIICGALGLFAWAQRTSSIAGLYLSGVIAGLGCFTYFTARLAMPVLLILAVCTNRVGNGNPTRFRIFCALLLGMFMAALPAVVNAPTLLKHMLGQTVFANTAGNSGMAALSTSEWTWSMAGEVSRQFYLTLIHPAVFQRGPSFVVPPVFNPLESTLVLVGLFGLLLAIAHDAGARAVVTASMLCAFVVGAISQYGTPPITRLVFLSPFLTLFAAIALDRIVTVAAQYHAGLRRHGTKVCVAIALFAAAWSAIQVQTATLERPRGAAPGTTAEAVRLARLQPPGTACLFIDANDTPLDALDLWLDAYGFSGQAVVLGGREPRRRSAAMVNLANIAAAVRALDSPCLIVYNLQDSAVIGNLRRAVTERFPKSAIQWQTSDPGKSWSLTYASINRVDE